MKAASNVLSFFTINNQKYNFSVSIAQEILQQIFKNFIYFLCINLSVCDWHVILFVNMTMTSICQSEPTCHPDDTRNNEIMKGLGCHDCSVKWIMIASHIYFCILICKVSDIHVEGLGCSSGSVRGCVSPCFSTLIVLNMQYHMYIGEHTSTLQDRVQEFQNLPRRSSSTWRFDK